LTLAERLKKRFCEMISAPSRLASCRAIPVKVAAKRLPVFPFSGFDLYHHFRNDAFYDLYNLLKVRKTEKLGVVLLQPLPE
jgi:hypothetical protein